MGEELVKDAEETEAKLRIDWRCIQQNSEQAIWVAKIGGKIEGRVVSFTNSGRNLPEKRNKSVAMLSGQAEDQGLWFNDNYKAREFVRKMLKGEAAVIALPDLAKAPVPEREVVAETEAEEVVESVPVVDPAKQQEHIDAVELETLLRAAEREAATPTDDYRVLLHLRKKWSSERMGAMYSIFIQQCGQRTLLSAESNSALIPIAFRYVAGDYARAARKVMENEVASWT